MPNDYPQRVKDDAAEDDFFATQLRAGTISADMVNRLKNIKPVTDSAPAVDAEISAPVPTDVNSEENEPLATVRYIDD